MVTPSPFRRAVSEGSGRRLCVVQSASLEPQATQWRENAVLELQKQRSRRDSELSARSSLASDVAAATRGVSAQDPLWPSMPTVEMHGEEMSHHEETVEQTSRWQRAWPLTWKGASVLRCLSKAGVL